MADRLAIVSAERIRDEFTKLVLSGDPRAGLRILVDTGLADQFIPELPALQLEIDEHHRHKDVYEHTLTVVEQAIDLEQDGPDLTLRLAALLHDIGKPATRRFEGGGGVSFHHHEMVGARMTRKRMKALRYPKDLIDDVAQLVELHLRFHGYAEGEWTDSAVRRYVRDAGPLLSRLHSLTRADCTTRNRRKAASLAAAYTHLEERIAALAEAEELASIRPDLDGNEIMQILGIPPGRAVGRGLPAPAGDQAGSWTTRPGRGDRAAPAVVGRASAGGVTQLGSPGDDGKSEVGDTYGCGRRRAGEDGHGQRRHHGDTDDEGGVEDDVVGDEDPAAQVVVDRLLQDGVDGDLEQLCPPADAEPRRPAGHRVGGTAAE